MNKANTCFKGSGPYIKGSLKESNTLKIKENHKLWVSEKLKKVLMKRLKGNNRANHVDEEGEDKLRFQNKMFS